MRVYDYKARSVSGRIVDGTLRAANSDDALRLLEDDGMVPVSIHASDQMATSPATSGIFLPRVKVEDIIVFTRQLSTMLRAGMPMLQTFTVLRGQTGNPRLAEALGQIESKIAGGSTLSEAMAAFPKIFPPQYISVVVSGESGADLVEALLRVAEWMEYEHEIMTEIKAALRYPILVLSALAGVAALMLTFVIPKFAAFFAKSSVPLPLPTRMLVAGNQWLQSYWWLLLTVIALGSVASVLLLRVPEVRLRFDEWKFRLPLAGPLYSKLTISRFSRILAMLIANGVPVLGALAVSADVANNSYLRQATLDARQRIQDGSSIYEGMSTVAVFPVIMTNLIAIGEKTGTLDQMLEFVVMQYDMEIKYALKNLTVMIEPIITVIIGVAVLFLALAVYLPIWDLTKVVRR